MLACVMTKVKGLMVSLSPLFIEEVCHDSAFLLGDTYWDQKGLVRRRGWQYILACPRAL